MKLTKAALATLIILVVVAFIGMFLATGYNSLVKNKAEIDNSWAQVETQYQRRLDLITNLVSSVKGSQTQEQKVFGDIAEARTRYSGATNSNDKAEAASKTESALGRLLVITESYPELKSNANIQSLISQLSATEDTIATARNSYNSAAKDYNISVSVFPKNLLANMFGYEKQKLFQADKSAASAPQVKL